MPPAWWFPSTALVVLGQHRLATPNEMETSRSGVLLLWT
jgi:hypothetical protein